MKIRCLLQGEIRFIQQTWIHCRNHNREVETNFSKTQKPAANLRVGNVSFHLGLALHSCCPDWKLLPGLEIVNVELELKEFFGFLSPHPELFTFLLVSCALQRKLKKCKRKMMELALACNPLPVILLEFSFPFLFPHNSP